MTDCFISYTGRDQAWAEWIAYVLEEEGYTVVIQAWDFRPGSNFVVEMQRAASTADRTIMVLTERYLQSDFAEPEWVSAFSRDPKGLQQKLLPVAVEAVDAPGLLTSIVQIRINGVTEDAARAALLAGLDRSRAKPSIRPAFPGAVGHAQAKSFPGPGGSSSQGGTRTDEATVRPSPVPKLRLAATDADRRRFLRQGFETIRNLFEAHAVQASEHEPRITIDIEMRTNADLRGELFVDGASRGACRVWIDDMMGSDAILFAEGRSMSGNAHNDMITVSGEDELVFSALMAMGYTEFEKSHDMKRLSADDLASYLWARFVAPLSR